MDPYLSLLEYRNTPVGGLKSPAQILMSRRLRSILPSTTTQLRPQVTPQSLVQERREECQLRQKRHYDTSARPLPTPQAGALIRYQQEDGTWQPATIVKPAETPRSYHMVIHKTGDGQLLRRNRRHFISAQDTSPCTPTQTGVCDDTQTTQDIVPETRSPHHTPTTRTETCHRTRFGRAIKPRQVLDL